MLFLLLVLLIIFAFRLFKLILDCFKINQFFIFIFSHQIIFNLPMLFLLLLVVIIFAFRLFKLILDWSKITQLFLFIFRHQIILLILKFSKNKIFQ